MSPKSHPPNQVPQLTLFEEVGLGTEQATKKTTEKAKSFVSPSCEGVLFAGHLLKDYLKENGLGWAVQLRNFLQELDWSLFEEKYPGNGRAPYAPSAMMGIIFYGIMQGQASLRELEELARKDLACIWIAGGIRPDHSVIGRFLLRHTEVLSSVFFEDVTRKALQILGSSTHKLAGDGTVIAAAASRYKAIRLEAAREALEKAKEKLAKSPSDEELQSKVKEVGVFVEIIEARAAERKKKDEILKKQVLAQSSRMRSSSDKKTKPSSPPMSHLF